MKKLFAGITVLILLFFLYSPLFAQENSSDNGKKDIENKIKEYEQKLSGIRQQKNTLSSQIQYMDTQIYLTALRIQDTERKFGETQKEIETLTTRIEGLDDSLDYLSKLLIEKVSESYKKRSLSFLSILLDSANAEEFLSQSKYLRATRENNQKLLVQVQETKINFEEQIKLREEKKKQLEELERKLIIQKNDLNYQKTQKQSFLRDTQNDEKKYQELLEQALAEYNAIQKAIITGSKVGEVKKGDPIALVGNTGYPYCSTGPHLHFEVRSNNMWVSPENFLSQRTVVNEQNNRSLMGSGSWDWPIQDPIIVTQEYGKTPWSWRYAYSGGVHTGIDMWTKSSEVIRAPADGTLYSSSQNCGSSTIKIKYIDHGGGIISFYLHVQ